MKCLAVALTLALAAPVAAQADTLPPDICQRMAAQIRSETKPPYLSQWPGMEGERVIETVGGNMPYRPVLQADKARLLKEAAANDPSRLDMWRVLLASSAAERDEAEAHLFDGRLFQGLAVRELSSMHLGRVIMPIGGSLGCERVSDYYTGKDGKVHIPPQTPAGSDEDGADTCVANGYTGFYRWQDRVLFINISGDNDLVTTYLVSARDGETRWTPQCRIDAAYTSLYRAKPFDAYGARTPAVVLMANPRNVLMASQVDTWGHAYRPYYDTRKPEERQAIQARLLAGRPGVDFNAFLSAIKAAGAYTQDSDLYIPVDFQGTTTLVKVAQGWLRQEPQPNIEFEMYELKDGRAILVGAVDTDLVPGVLEKLTVSPL